MNGVVHRRVRTDPYDVPLTRKQRLWFALALTVLALLVTVVGCAAPLTVAPASPSAPAMAVARMESEAGYCTVWNAGGGVGLTAGHCCGDPGPYRMGPGSGVLGSAIRVLAVDQATDACAVAAAMLGAPLELAEQEPAIGDPVWAAGYAVTQLLVSGGYWSGLDVEEGPVRGVASLAIAPGASGAPVVDRRGRAVGIVSAMPAFSARGIQYPVTSVARLVTLDGTRAILRRGRAVLDGTAGEL